jgi:thiol-disulfide isomerase/thioredoxin
MNKIPGILILVITCCFILSLKVFSEEKSPTVEDVYLGLSSGPLRYARLVTLPDGILLRAGDVTINQKQVDEKIAQSEPELQEQLKRNAFYVLEQAALYPILLSEAKKWMATQNIQSNNPNEDEHFKLYLESLVPPDLTISDQEAQIFYDQNHESFGEVSFNEVKETVIDYLLSQKKQEAINAYVRSLSQHLEIEVNADWVKVQSESALDNSVDQARRNGLPVMVDFGASGCVPCDMMAPILEELQMSLKEKCTILFTDVRIYQVLSARYQISNIPTQVFFDREGIEVFRHTGFFSKEEILDKLAELGVD